jgi:hypothetical protein
MEVGIRGHRIEELVVSRCAALGVGLMVAACITPPPTATAVERPASSVTALDHEPGGASSHPSESATAPVTNYAGRFQMLARVHDPPKRTGPLTVDVIDAANWPLTYVESTVIVGVGTNSWSGNKRAGWFEFFRLLHERLHPIFSDQFLTSLDAGGPASPFNNPALNTLVMVEVFQATGELSTITIVESSGLLTFDLAALETFARVTPLSVPSILSDASGIVRFAWRFSRPPEVACTSLNASPIVRPVPGGTGPTSK